MLSVVLNYAAIIPVLLLNSPTIGAINENGDTALGLAAFNSSATTVGLLLAAGAGAQVNSVNKYGKPSLSRARLGVSPVIASCSTAERCVLTQHIDGLCVAWQGTKHLCLQPAAGTLRLYSCF